MAETNPEPRKVVLFSGHMIDAPGRESRAFRPTRSRSPPAPSPRRSRTSISGRATGASAAARAAATFCSRRPPSRAPLGSSSTFPSTSRNFWKSRSTSPTTTGAPAISRRKRAPCCTCCRSSADRRQPARTPTNATIAGCWRPPRASVRTRSISSASGTASAATDRAASQHMMEEVQKAGGRAHWLDTRKLWD